MYKRDIINWLFVLSFSVYGLGSYVSASMSPAVGYIVSCLPHLAIVIFHVLDLLDKKEFVLKLNGTYLLVLTYIMTMIISLFVALSKGLPEATMGLMICKSILLVVPFHAFIIVYLYNTDADLVPKLVLKGLILLLLFNLVGFYGLGLSNEVHSIEGRISFPFLEALYSGAFLIAIINLMLFYTLRKSITKPLTAFYSLSFFLINLFFFFNINSRLITLVFLLVIALMIFNVAKKFVGLYTVSIFTMPLLLNVGLLLYQILNLPVFQVIMQRVDLLDVITFHGRSLLWESAMDWLYFDQRGLIFGNGYKGHYFLDLLGDIIKLFDLKGVHHLHLHSSTLEIVVAQGLFGLTLYLIIFYKAYKYYKKRYQEGVKEGIFFPVVVFMMFVAHVDLLLYLDNLGGLVFAFVLARTAITVSPVIQVSTDHQQVENNGYTSNNLTFRSHDQHCHSRL